MNKLIVAILIQWEANVLGRYSAIKLGKISFICSTVGVMLESWISKDFVKLLEMSKIWKEEVEAGETALIFHSPSF